MVFPSHATYGKRKIGINYFLLVKKKREGFSRYRDNESRQFKVLPLGKGHTFSVICNLYSPCILLE